MKSRKPMSSSTGKQGRKADTLIEVNIRGFPGQIRHDSSKVEDCILAGVNHGVEGGRKEEVTRPKLPPPQKAVTVKQYGEPGKRFCGKRKKQRKMRSTSNTINAQDGFAHWGCRNVLYQL